MSSLGVFKRDVHVTKSTSVTNACYFRHALALDEHRVKFTPEYFSEINAYRSIRSPRSSDSDVKEVWFAGSRSDMYVTFQTTEDINLTRPHPVEGLVGLGHHITKWVYSLGTMIPVLTLSMLAMYRFYG